MRGVAIDFVTIMRFEEFLMLIEDLDLGNFKL